MEIQKIKDISILLAEDEDELREFLKEYLQIFFIKVHTAECGDEAYMLYKDKKPDIIITDINMPSMDGLTLISKIREDDKDTKIIVMSAHSEEEKLLKAIELHLETYLIKPINAEKLKHVLLEAVENIRKAIKRIYLSEDIYWEMQSQVLYKDNNPVPLKAREVLVLNMLCATPNQPISPQDIFYEIYKNDREKEFSSDSITSLIKRLRSKIPKESLTNVYGAGYKIIPV
ncbi:MAG: response regulator transcription factor [Thiovulaceae bacterium]|nr:response regulator transcription factor [Sulfurimonadaceae bacterium]MCW9027089.1 response regulator transcription factor [Sulfurimonadaceae bacterium]